MAAKRRKKSDPGVLEGVPVLVVEDHAASGRMVTAVLAAAGAEVAVVTTAEQAIEVVGAFRPQALVVDLVLPGMSGTALVRTLKADVRTRGIVCIAVTVNGDDVERTAREAGCAALVRKPIDTETFAPLVRRHLEVTK